MSLVGSVKRSRGSSRADSNTLSEENLALELQDFGMYEGTRKQRRATPHE